MEKENKLDFKELYSRFFDRKNTSSFYYTWAGEKGRLYFCKKLNNKKYKQMMEKRAKAGRSYYQKNADVIIKKQVEKNRRKKCQKIN